MRRYEPLFGFLGLVVVTAILWTIILWACFGIYKYFHPCEPQVTVKKSHTEYLADRWSVARHKYHGIPVSFENRETGEKWFVNENGQKCKL